MTTLVKQVSETLSQFSFVAVPVFIFAYLGFEVLVAILSENNARAARRIYWFAVVLTLALIIFSLAGPFAAQLKARMPPTDETLNALITCNGGEQLDIDNLMGAIGEWPRNTTLATAHHGQTTYSKEPRNIATSISKSSRFSRKQLWPKTQAYATPRRKGDAASSTT